MIKLLIIIFSVFLLSSCNNDSIIGKKIICEREKNEFNLDNVRSYEFIAENILITIKRNYDDPFQSFTAKNLVGDQKKYNLTSDTIEVYQNENNISEIINRKDLTINFYFDNNRNYRLGECKVIKGDIRIEIQGALISRGMVFKENLFYKIKNFFSKFQYKI